MHVLKGFVELHTVCVNGICYETNLDGCKLVLNYCECCRYIELGCSLGSDSGGFDSLTGGQYVVILRWDVTEALAVAESIAIILIIVNTTGTLRLDVA